MRAARPPDRGLRGENLNGRKRGKTMTGSSNSAQQGRTMRLLHGLSLAGLVIGTLFFTASLAPSLLPRGFALQGVLSGCSFAAGYGVGVFLTWLWRYLELPVVPEPRLSAMKSLGLAACALAAAFSLWRASNFQDSVRVLMELPPVESGRPVEVAIIAVLVFAAILIVARIFAAILVAVAGWLGRLVPRRVANVAGAAIVILVFWTAIDGLLFKSTLRIADASFQRFDALIEPDVEKPEEAHRTGSLASLVAWQSLGRAGRQFVAATPAAQDIAALADGEDPGQAPGSTMEPVRVYVGLNSAETVDERARLALAEMLRVGAFDRSVLVLVTPTGTGWIDPSAIEPLEALHRGDVATVALQYSYLTSWLSLLFEPAYGSESARALFRVVYDHWTTLPEEERPRLYLYGLSLGALNSDLSADLYDVLGDPFHGALWVAPPFSAPTWRNATAGRQPDTPAWLPRFRDGSVIRFANQHGLVDRDSAWGPLRIVFLQYASDPVTFFRPDAFYRIPPWMDRQRGPDVSGALRWFPIVTLLQLGLDMALATTTPMGFGHVYAPEHHVDPWVEVTRPAGWSEAGLARLKAHFAAARQASTAVGE